MPVKVVVPLATLRGDGDEARRQWRAVLAECPGDAEALERLKERKNPGARPMDTWA